MKASAEHMSYWSMKLLVSFQQMAARKTNAVLALLADVDQLQTECRYPEAGLWFAGNHWRAFYHCHQAESTQNDEHGHFHLFTDIGNHNWAHVAGLSIDAEGQPLQWFTTNRWVTDGPWLEIDDFAVQLKYISAQNKEESLVTSWLGALLQLYAESLHDLLIKRDEQLKLNLKGRSRFEVFQDRDLYTLSTQSIALPEMLEKHLLYKRLEKPEVINNSENIKPGV
jgi:hypothetical protein